MTRKTLAILAAVVVVLLVPAMKWAVEELFIRCPACIDAAIRMLG